jgi:LysR family transcriptional regulator, carnitine catabolism transcriptional activator
MRIVFSLDQLAAVVAVAGERSFSRAAEVRLLAQSSLSRTVAQVERVSGVRLFDRTTRQVTLTREGEEFVKMATDILASYERETKSFAAYLAGQRGVLRLAALPSLAASLLPQMIRRFRSRFPEMTVEVEDVLAGQITEQVQSGVIDVAITAAPAKSLEASMSASGIRFDVVAADTFYCVLPLHHRLLDKPVVQWSDLAGEEFVAFDQASSVREIVDRVLVDQGVVPARLISARNVASVAGLCAAGLGVSAAPGFVLPLMAVPGTTTRPFGGTPVERQIGVLRSAGRLAPPAQQFLDIVYATSADDIALPDGTRWSVAATHDEFARPGRSTPA